MTGMIFDILVHSTLPTASPRQNAKTANENGKKVDRKIYSVDMKGSNLLVPIMSRRASTHSNR